MKRCPECGFRAEDTICPLCGVKMKPEKAAQETLQTHAHTQAEERCSVEQKPYRPARNTDPIVDTGRHPVSSQERQSARTPGLTAKLVWVLTILILYFVLQSMCSGNLYW